jgi:peptide/nickel transport system substrate-binding protein
LTQRKLICYAWDAASQRRAAREEKMINRLLTATALGLVAMTAWTTAASAQDAAGNLTIAFAAEATTMDPAKSAAGVDGYFTSQMFEMLVRPDPNLESVNWLATSWELTEVDGKTVLDIVIRDDVTFHNGDPLTSADFEFSYQRQANPEISKWPHLQKFVEEFEIIDDHHFRIHFSAPDSNYVAGNLQLYAMPKKYIEEVGDEEFARNPVGTGPYKFVSFTPKEELKLEAYDGYWNKEHRPTVKTVTVKIIPEDLTRVAALQTGEVDLIDAVPPQMVQQLDSNPKFETVSLLSGNNLFLQFPEHLESSPFSKPEVRRAVAHSIDINAIVKSVLFGQGEIYSEIGRGTSGYDETIQPYAYDPAKAKELLTQAGYPNGFDTSCYNLTTPREPNVKEYGEAMFAYMAQVGIRCRVEGLEYGAWISLGKRSEDTRQLDGPISWMWGHGLPGDVGSPWNGHLRSYEAGSGYGSYSYASNPDIDTMLDEAAGLMDPEARAAKLREIAQLKHERVTGGLTTYRPLVNFAWNAEKVTFTPWPWPGYWRSLQELGLK